MAIWLEGIIFFTFSSCFSFFWIMTFSSHMNLAQLCKSFFPSVFTRTVYLSPGIEIFRTLNVFSESFTKLSWPHWPVVSPVAPSLGFLRVVTLEWRVSFQIFKEFAIVFWFQGMIYPKATQWMTFWLKASSLSTHLRIFHQPQQRVALLTTSF